MDFAGKTIAIGVYGSIAAYRTADLIRVLYQQGAHRVLCLMTPSAEAFISSLTLQSLSRQPVYTDPLALTPDGTPVHIAVAQQADALLLMPLTANGLAKLAHGLADDLVSTTALTFTGKPVLLAPAMNTRMWQNPLTQQNLQQLVHLPNITLIEPTAGLLACGETGEGHLAEPASILRALYQATHPQQGLLKNVSVLVTAGGTREALDPVRFLTNRSSGKMGIALADECHAMGAQVTLIAAHTQAEDLGRPYPVHRVETAAQMQETVTALFTKNQVLIMAAAVSDFTIAEPASQKIKRHADHETPLELTLLPTADILASLKNIKRPEQFVVGFAAESVDAEDLLSYAQGKLVAKDLDMLVANDISRPDIGFNADENEVTLLFKHDKPVWLPKCRKDLLARQILLQLSQKLATKHQLLTV